MSYELEKELAIKDALLADWENKNRRLREIVDETERKKGEVEEQLSVNKSMCTEKLNKYIEGLKRCHQKGREEYGKAKKTHESNEATITGLQNQLTEQKDIISKQNLVIEDLTSDILRVNRFNGLLQVKLEKAKDTRSTLNKLDKVLTKFE